MFLLIFKSEAEINNNALKKFRALLLKRRDAGGNDEYDRKYIW
jgi:hypothetical protein